LRKAVPGKNRPAIFLDRDGVLIVEKDFSISPDEIEFYPETLAALAAIKNDYLKVVVSNQSGVARGYFKSEDVEKFNSELDRRLRGNGTVIDGWYFCPHGPEDNCPCRKPKPGLIQRAMEELGADPGQSWIIGDKSSDIEAGKACGINTILVKTGYGGKEPGASTVSPDYTAADIRDAVEHINRSSK
jgi:histidinol-phosphate phosphatase family protein